MSHIPHIGLDQGREALRRFLVGDDDLDAMPSRIAMIATETVPGCDLASITMVRRGEPRTPVFTDKAARRSTRPGPMPAGAGVADPPSG